MVLSSSAPFLTKLCIHTNHMRPLISPSVLLFRAHQCGNARSFISFPSTIFSLRLHKHILSPKSPALLFSFRCFSRFTQDFYSIIGVTKSATQSEIKQEYFRKAKKYHPDLNPNDKNAVKKFQELATAYETLGNPQRRLEYDRLGYQQYTQQTSRNQQQYGQATAPDANDVFNEVYQDFEIITSAWNDYIAETKSDFVYACKEADQNNWTPMYDIAKANSVLIVGVVVPLAIVIRMPAAVGVAMRFLLPIASGVGVAVIRSGNSAVFAAYLWKKLVEIARNRKKRK
jgi:hypothetical protein